MELTRIGADRPVRAGAPRSAPFATRPLALAILVALASGWSIPAAAKPSVLLRYHLRPGAAYDGAVSVSMTTQMSMEGLPEEAAAMAQAIGKDLVQRVSMRTSLVVGREQPGGALPVEFKILDGQVRMTMAGQPIEVPGLGDAISKAPALQGKLAPGGRRIEMDSGALESVPGLPSDAEGRIGQVMPALPDGEMKVGDSFDVPFKMSLPGLPMAGRMTTDSKCTYTLESLGDDLAVFKTSTNVSGGLAGGGESGMKMTLSGGGGGKAVFDLKEGIFTEARADLKVEMTMEMSYPTGSDPAPEGDAAGPKLVKIHATIEGPVSFTMSRASSAK